MAIGKKGIAYLYVASIFVIIFMMIFLAYKQYSYSDRQKVVETRILTINEFIKDLDFDAKRVIYVSGFRSLIALEDYVARSGMYIHDIEGFFKVAFYNGTINGTAVEILKNSTYSDYLRNLNAVSQRVGIMVDVNVTNITLYHDTPWSIAVVVTTRINVTDIKGLASWDFTKNYTTSVALTNIRDPIYSVSTYGKVPNTIRRTNITQMVDSGDVEGLAYHVNNSLYIESTLAPSFLMRLQGNFNSSPYGIESIVFLPELIIQEVDYDEDKSQVDYVFFTNITGFEDLACDVDDMPSWFKVDLNHTGLYEINELNYTEC